MLMVAYDDPLSTVVAIANGLSIDNNSSITVHSAPSGSKLRITLFWLSSNTAQRACYCSTTLSSIAKAELHLVSHCCTNACSGIPYSCCFCCKAYVALVDL